MTVRAILVIIVSCSYACSNALYFYDTQKISFTAEARPDSSEPVQGNLGLKHREAIVVPPKDEGGDALSLICHFRFDKGSVGVFGIGPISIRSALVTGDAASGLSPSEGQQVATALSGVELSSYSDSAKRTIERVKNNNKLAELQLATTKRFQDLNASDFAKLETLTSFDQKHFNQSFYNELQDQAAKANQ